MSTNLIKRALDEEFAALDERSKAKSTKTKKTKKIQDSLSTNRHGLKKEKDRLRQIRSAPKKLGSVKAGKNSFRFNQGQESEEKEDIDQKVKQLKQLTQSLSEDVIKSIHNHTKREKRFRKKPLTDEEKKKRREQKREAAKSVFTEEDFENLRSACFINSKVPPPQDSD